MDDDAAAGVADELGRRIAARPGMKLQAESFSLATQAVDMRTGIDGLSSCGGRRVQSARSQAMLNEVQDA